MTAGKAVATLAFSEKGSRSHFWAPVSRASSNSGTTILNCEKSFVPAPAMRTFTWFHQCHRSEEPDRFNVIYRREECSRA